MKDLKKMKLNIKQIRKLKKLSIEQKREFLIRICRDSKNKDLQDLSRKLPYLNDNLITLYFNSMLGVVNNGC